MLAHALLWISVPFVLTTLFFGFYKGDNVYYESDLYDGHGTAHPVLLDEESDAKHS